MCTTKIARSCMMLLIIAGVLPMVGCWVPALQPLYDDTNTLWDQSLLGIWSTPNCTDSDKSRECTMVLRGEPRAREYELVLTDDSGMAAELSATRAQPRTKR